MQRVSFASWPVTDSQRCSIAQLGELELTTARWEKLTSICKNEDLIRYREVPLPLPWIDRIVSHATRFPQG